MTRKKRLPLSEHPTSQLLWASEVLANAQRLAVLRPGLASRVLRMFDEAELDNRVAVALVDTAIHFGMALEARRANLTVSNHLPYDAVEALATHFDERFRASLAQLATPLWVNIRGNALTAAGNMGVAVANHFTAGGISANVVAAVQPVEANCVAVYGMGGGVICAVDPNP